MKEAEKDSGEESLDRPIPKDEDGKEDPIEKEDSNDVDFEIEEPQDPLLDYLPEEPFYKDILYNLPREFIFIEEVYKWYYYYYYYSDEIEERREGLNKHPLYNLNKHLLYKNILNAFIGNCAPAIFGHLRKVGAATVKELVEELGFQQQTVSLALKSLKIARFVVVRRKIKTRGKPADIWALIPAELKHINRAENEYYEILLKEGEEQKGESKYTVDNIKAEIKDYLDSKGIEEASLREIYPHFKSIFTDFNDFSKACVELSREGYKIWL